MKVLICPRAAFGHDADQVEYEIECGAPFQLLRGDEAKPHVFAYLVKVHLEDRYLAIADKCLNLLEI